MNGESDFFRPVSSERRWYPAVDAFVIVRVDYVDEVKAFGVLISLHACHVSIKFPPKNGIRVLPRNFPSLKTLYRLYLKILTCTIIVDWPVIV